MSAIQTIAHASTLKLVTCACFLAISVIGFVTAWPNLCASLAAYLVKTNMMTFTNAYTTGMMILVFPWFFGVFAALLLIIKRAAPPMTPRPAITWQQRVENLRAPETNVERDGGAS